MLNDLEVFTSEDEAYSYLRNLRGWPEKIAQQLYFPDHSKADADGNVWVIMPSEGMYLRTDGFVR